VQKVSVTKDIMPLCCNETDSSYTWIYLLLRREEHSYILLPSPFSCIVKIFIKQDLLERQYLSLSGVLRSLSKFRCLK